ncbi:MAG: SsrA-binding protein SmpB [Myxococcota bacterium]|nr:SsrA-binding protein SmpB [Myxococcota bacterium]
MAKTGEINSVARNRKARHDYHVTDEFEAGMVLKGTEVKSLRDGKCQMVDAYVQIDNGEAFVHQLHIAEYKNGTIYNHEPKRLRKLLLKHSEIEKLDRQVTQKGMTLVPLEVYFKQGRAKMKVGVCRGKKQHDKRAAIKDRDTKRDIRRQED